MLGVSVETLRRWETEGRLTMERSEGGQRLVDIERGLAPARREATVRGDRPIVAQSARNRFAGHRDAGRTRRRRRGRRGHRRPAPARQPDDRRGRRRARPQGRRRGGLRRQGHQRHRRDPVVAGSRAREAAPGRDRRHPGARSLAALSQAGGERRRRRRDATVDRPRDDGAVRGRRRAHDLRRRVAQGRARRGEDRLRGGQPGRDAHDLDRLVVRARRRRSSRALPPTSSSRPTRRTRRRSSTRAWPTAPAVTFASNKLTVIVPADNPAGIRTPADLAKPASRSSPPGTRCRSRSTRRQLVANLAEGARLPGRLRGRLRRQRRVEGGQRQGGRRQDRARRGRRRDRLRHRRGGVDEGRRPSTSPMPRTCRQPTTASSSRPRRTSTRRTAFLDLVRRSRGPGDPRGFGFLPPPS